MYVLKAPSYPPVLCPVSPVWHGCGLSLISARLSRTEGGLSPLLPHTPPHAAYTCAAKQLGLVESRTPAELAPPPGAVFAEAPFQDGYDLTIGTSERGSDVASAQLPSFRWVQPGAGAGAGGGGTEQRAGLVGGRAGDWPPLCGEGCSHCGLDEQPAVPPPWVPGTLSWCSGASRGWKLEWMLIPTWRWLSPVSSLICM